MNKIYRYLIGSVGIIVMIAFVIIFPQITAWILVSVVIAMIGAPLVELLSKIKIKKIKFPRWLAAGITLLTFYLAIFAFFYFFIPLMFGQINEFRKLDVETISIAFEQPINSIDQFIHEYNLADEQDFSIRNYALDEIQKIVNFSNLQSITNTLTNTIKTFLLALFSITFISFFFLKEQQLFDKAIVALMPEKSEQKTITALESIKKLTSRYFIGLILETLAIAAITIIGLLIAGMKFDLAILIGIITGLFNIIPFIGSVIALIFGLLLIIAGTIGLNFYTTTMPLIYALLIIFVIARIIDFALQPIIFSKSVKAHPLEIFLIILIAGFIAGIIGMIVAIPAYTVLRVVAKEFFQRFKFVRVFTKSLDDKEIKNQ